MSFKNDKSANKNKNLFVARLVSKNTGKTISWLNLTDEFARRVFACELRLVTAEQALETLPAVFNNDIVEVEITDLTAEIEQVKATDF